MIFTLANGWELEFSNLPEPLKLPQTFEAKRLS
jgi:nitrogen fixation protein NifT